MPEERLSNGMPSAAAAVGHPLLNRENRAKFFIKAGLACQK
jgi:hypothetical protein